MGTPIGLVVIPSSMAPDGNARMIALTDIEYEGGGEGPIKSEEDTGNLRSTDPSGKNNFYWQNYSGNEPNEDVYWYDSYVFNIMEDDSIEYHIMTMNTCDQAAMSTDISGVTANPIADGEYYTSDNYPPVVSPYMMESDEINPNYLQENWVVGGGGQPDRSTKATVLGVNYNALSDFSGLTWTKLLAVNQAPYSKAQGYSTSGTNAGDWYVPSMGEAGFLQARWRAIAGILVSLFSESENYNAYPYEGIYYTSTLLNQDGMKTGATPFVYYVSQEQAQQESPLASTQSTRDIKLGTSYPSDVPIPLMGGYDLGLTLYGTSSPISAVQPKKEGKDENTVLRSSIYTAYVYVRPMAMIKNGQIVTEVGTPVANNHQISDLDTDDVQAF